MSGTGARSRGGGGYDGVRVNVVVLSYVTVLSTFLLLFSRFARNVRYLGDYIGVEERSEQGESVRNRENI